MSYRGGALPPPCVRVRVYARVGVRVCVRVCVRTCVRVGVCVRARIHAWLWDCERRRHEVE